MTEISFARSFLSALDARPIKLSSDHTSDPRKFATGAIYTLPSYSSSPAKRKRGASTSDVTAGAASAKQSQVNVQLSYAKSPKHGLELEAQALTTSVFDLKSAYASKRSVPVDKIKLLFSKKPVADSKTLKDLLPDGTSEADFTVMLMGGVTPSDATPAAEQSTVPAAQGPSGKDILATDQFWDDLKSFLVQRLKDEDEGKRLAAVFRKAAQ